MNIHKIKNTLLPLFRERAKPTIEISYVENSVFRLSFFASPVNAQPGVREYASRHHIICAFVCGIDWFTVRYHGDPSGSINRRIPWNSAKNNLLRICEETVHLYPEYFITNGLEALLIPENLND